MILKNKKYAPKTEQMILSEFEYFKYSLSIKVIRTFVYYGLVKPANNSLHMTELH